MPQFEMLDRQRIVEHADVMFDTNVIRGNDDAAERDLHALTELLIETPDQGNIWFSLTSLAEILAPATPAARIEMLRRFRNLYLRFGERVRFMSSLKENVRAECLRQPFPSGPANSLDADIAQSIQAGDLIGRLKEARDEWQVEKERLHFNYRESKEQNQRGYSKKPGAREAHVTILPRFFSIEALGFCDDIARDLINHCGDLVSLAMVKERHRDYPCVWTFSALVRLAQCAQSISHDELQTTFASLQDVLGSDKNDFIDADIAATGAHCGIMVTNDHRLIRKLNRLHDAGLTRIQALTVHDAFVAYNPPNGRVRLR